MNVHVPTSRDTRLIAVGRTLAGMVALDRADLLFLSVCMFLYLDHILVPERIERRFDLLVLQMDRSPGWVEVQAFVVKNCGPLSVPIALNPKQ